MTNHMKDFLSEGRKLRQELRKHGFFLIIEESQDTAFFLKGVVKGKEARCRNAKTVDEALTIIETEGKDIRCAVIDLAVPDSKGKGGVRVIEHLESACSGIPYVVHSNDRKQSERIVARFPRASVLLKGAQFCEIISMLGLTHENETENQHKGASN